MISQEQKINDYQWQIEKLGAEDCHDKEDKKAKSELWSLH